MPAVSMVNMMKIDTVTTKEFTMDYFCFGHGKEALVILPGLSVQSVMGFADSVADAYKQMTDDFTVYVFDRRKNLPDKYSIQEMAQDTKTALESLGLKHISIFGASQGGMIAMEIAAAHPECMQKLILGSTSARVDETRYRTFQHWIDLAKNDNAKELYLNFGEKVYPNKVFEGVRKALTEAAKTVTGEELIRFIKLAESMKDYDITEKLGKIECPVLTIGDKEDQVFGEEAALLISKYLGSKPGFKLCMYEGFGHAAYDTAPDYRKLMLNFLQQP